MVLQKEEHRTLLLELFDQVNFPGRSLDIAAELKAAIKNARVFPPIEGGQHQDKEHTATPAS